MSRPRAVYVEWVDAAIVQGVWGDRKGAVSSARRFATSPIRSAGLLLDETPRSVTLAVSHNPNNGDVAMVFVIPRASIRKMRRLR